jgi:hypothetical protein
MKAVAQKEPDALTLNCFTDVMKESKGHNKLQNK